MSEPKQPEDPELKNIIDKLANFVARNGPEFEKMTKQKQQGNPKFSFLFSGEHFPYYRYKVAFEQAGMQNTDRMEGNQQMHFPPFQQSLLPPPLLNTQAPPISSSQSDKIEGVIDSLREQIDQSETNLSAQFQTIMQLQQEKVEETLIEAKMQGLQKDAQGLGVSLEELAGVLEPVISTCTKDAITTAKTWMLEHMGSSQHTRVVMQYLLERVLQKDSSFEHRLHLIYLTNDLVHHSSRKGSKELIETIEELVVVPAYAFTFVNASESEKNKMNKLLTLWENHKYFKEATLQHLRDSSAGLAAYQAQLISSFSSVVSSASMETNKQMQQLQQQHHKFVCHISSQISVLQQQQQLQISLHKPPTHNNNNDDNDDNDNNDEKGGYGGRAVERVPLLPPAWLPTHNQPPLFNNNRPNNPNDDEIWNNPIPEGPIDFPDLTKPPPGFPPIPPNTHSSAPSTTPIALSSHPPLPELDLVPNIPYYDLPAGLIVPLVKLEDCDYTPLHPSSLRLPPPMPPTERLLAAVEAFYAPPSHERPRDSEGWEKLGLFEFFKAKNKAKLLKVANDNLNAVANDNNNAVDNDNNITTTISNISKRTFVENKKNARRSSRSPGSVSPGQRSASSRSRSASADEDDSIDPFYNCVDSTSRLQEDNRGHQLMRKMGWGGGALGSSGVGILDPIEGGEVRDKVDQFRGLGLKSDPFEKYRKNMSSGFNHRMRERSDHRSTNRNH